MYNSIVLAWREKVMRVLLHEGHITAELYVCAVLESSHFGRHFLTPLAPPPPGNPPPAVFGCRRHRRDLRSVGFSRRATCPLQAEATMVQN